MKRRSGEQDPAEEEKTTNQARLELPTAQFDRLRKAAERRGLSITAFLRMAVLKEIERIEEGRD